MLIAVLSILIVILSLAVGASAIILKRLLDQRFELIRANEEFAHYMKLLNRQLQISISTMKQIDDRGVFEKDDEVGIAFQALRNCTELLVPFTFEEIDEEQTEVQ